MSTTRLKTFEDLIRQLHESARYALNNFDHDGDNIVLTDKVPWSEKGSVISTYNKEIMGPTFQGEDKTYISMQGLWKRRYSHTIPRNMDLGELHYCIASILDGRTGQAYRSFLKAMNQETNYNSDECYEYIINVSMVPPIKGRWQDNIEDTARFFAQCCHQLDEEQRLHTEVV